MEVSLIIYYMFIVIYIYAVIRIYVNFRIDMAVMSDIYAESYHDFEKWSEIKNNVKVNEYGPFYWTKEQKYEELYGSNGIWQTRMLDRLKE